MATDRLVGACLLLASSLLTLTWCAVEYVRANPGRRLPGKLPDARQPPAFMPMGMLGLLCAILGGLVANGSLGVLTWVIAGVVIAAGLYPVQIVHNRRLRR
jgi:hypothetical protein